MNSNIIRITKALRKRSTDAENLLWRHLRAKRLGGLKFRRQQPIGNYIVDFVCFEKRIVIEVDGGGHALEKDKDNERDNWLIGEGFKVLRFWNNEVLQKIDGVLEVIRESSLNHPPLTPPIKGGENEGGGPIRGGGERR
ncbi:MAG: endonuclease domain-containing protein [Deltaproteobacteria bacterium]|nr:endonuclease domain-containing protein [Deltaproteobacteria bacterium]